MKHYGTPVRLESKQETKLTCLRSDKWNLNQFVALESLV